MTTEPASGRLLVVGDVHGCDVAFEALLRQLRLTPEDTLVQLGDVIDRGPGTREVIDRLIELENACQLVFLLGNHEESYLETLEDPDTLEDWLSFGGIETLQSYGEYADRLPERHIEFLRSGRNYFETKSFVMVHANLEPGVPFEKQSSDWLRWKKLTKAERPLPSGQQVICGHTSQKDGLPWVGNGWVCLDTFAYGGKYLTCWDCKNDRVYQADQKGNARGPLAIAKCRKLWGE